MDEALHAGPRGALAGHGVGGNRNDARPAPRLGKHPGKYTRTEQERERERVSASDERKEARMNASAF